MFADFKLDPQSQAHAENSQPELEFLDSPFDRWLKLADALLEKHSTTKNSGVAAQ
jgi:hypothetical protein